MGLWIFANYTFLKRIHGEEDHKEDYSQAPKEWPPKAWQPSPEDAEKLEKQEVPIAAEFAKVLGENVPLPSPRPTPHPRELYPCASLSARLSNGASAQSSKPSCCLPGAQSSPPGESVFKIRVPQHSHQSLQLFPF